METAVCKSEIENTFSSLRRMSYDEKNSPLLKEKVINKFLDSINELKKDLQKKSQFVYDINERIEKITWFNDLDDECLMLINDLISTAKDLHSTLIRQYVSVGFLKLKGIAKEEIKDFKNAIDELKEICQDLESIFFYLPQMPEFVETTKQLSLV
ncbi:MAG: hypothetical protein C0596_06170 [Marinilabiliales bacterium]|nr:MAG: hypothetical protein C0596_06170 [Marinilabiliales bacterium]